MKENRMEGINTNSTYRELPPGANIYGSGNSDTFRTGDWRSDTPVFIADRCNQCLLCYPVCPDSSIPVRNGQRLDFDYEHCKGCGICAAVCPFGAIRFGKEEQHE